MMDLPLLSEKRPAQDISSRRTKATSNSRKAKVTMITFLLVLLQMLQYHSYPSKTVSINGITKYYKSRESYDTTSSKADDKDPGRGLGSATLTPSSDHLHIAKHASVACDVPICSKLGVSILEQGGSAADSAVTVALCIGSINSHSSGIGGGTFITSKRSDSLKHILPSKNLSEIISIDAREMAPSTASKNMFKNRENLAKYGGLAVGIPGELRGLYTLYENHGSGNLSWYRLIQPVIELNRAGFKVSDVLGYAIDKVSSFFWENEEDWDHFFTFDKITGKKRLVKEGDIVKRVQLADTLELIAKNGSSDVFYDPEGPIAGSLAKAVQKAGGILTAEDFARYQPRVENALHTNFLGSDVYTSSGASSGPALVAGLNILEGYGEFVGGDGLPLQTHRLIESMKWMASVRSYLGDVVSDDVEGMKSKYSRIYKFLTKEWASEIRKNISDTTTFAWKYYEPAYQITEPKGTAHFSIVDAHNGAVSMTTTVNLLFGSLVLDPATGIILNNQMDDFSLPNTPNAFGLTPSIYNFIEPFKRPLSSTSPTIVVNKDRSIDLVIGAAGGSRITTAILEAIVRIYAYHLPLLETIAYPRTHHQLIPETVFVETPTSKDLVKSLQKKGHNVTLIDPLTAMNGIKKSDGVWHSVSDFWRKRGEAWGY